MDGDDEKEGECDVSPSLHGRMALDECPKKELFHTPSESAGKEGRKEQSVLGLYSLTHNYYNHLLN